MRRGGLGFCMGKLFVGRAENINLVIKLLADFTGCLYFNQKSDRHYSGSCDFSPAPKKLNVVLTYSWL